MWPLPQIQFAEGGKKDLKGLGSVAAMERDWQLILAHGKGSLCIFISLLYRSCSNTSAIGKSVSSKRRWRVSPAHGRPVGWVFLELWGFSNHMLTSALKDSFMWVQHGRCSCWKPRISTEGDCAGCKIQGIVGVCRERILEWLIQWVAGTVAWTWGIAGTVCNLAWGVDYKLRSRILLFEKQAANFAFILIGDFTCVLRWWSDCRAELITWIN